MSKILDEVLAANRAYVAVVTAFHLFPHFLTIALPRPWPPQERCSVMNNCAAWMKSRGDPTSR
jgi:hypothetical protein